jgi:hypothetical protein
VDPNTPSNRDFWQPSLHPGGSPGLLTEIEALPSN